MTVRAKELSDRVTSRRHHDQVSDVVKQLSPWDKLRQQLGHTKVMWCDQSHTESRWTTPRLT
jgi:hypothetical protein